MGCCRYDKPQSYVFLLVNPIINKMLAALKEPMRLDISDRIYDALGHARAATRVRDTAELEVLKVMRRPNISKITVTQTNDKEVLLEIDENAERDGTVQKNQIPPLNHGKARKVVKKVTKEAIGIIGVRV